MRATAVFLLVLAQLALCQGGWRCTQGPLLNEALAAQVDVSLGQAVVTDTNGQAYSLSGDYWKALPYANLKHVTVGEAGIWGIDASDHVYKYVGGSWAELPELLIQIDAGGDGFVVGVNAANRIYCLPSAYTVGFNGHSAASWKQLGGYLKYFSCGPYGCWGANSGDAVYFNPLTSAATCSFSGFQRIAGQSLKMIEVGTDGNAFGVNSHGHVFQRTGITKARPQGSGWHFIPCLGTMTQVSYDLGTIYGVSTTGVVMKATA